jgi:hypothetical protein
MTEYETIEFEWCVDCLALDANGTLGDGVGVDHSDMEHARRMDAQWPIVDGWTLSNNCDENCEGHFSWARCIGCGSTLGGDRHPAVAMRKVPA